MTMKKLDKEEQQLQKSLETGEWVKVPKFATEKKRYEAVARQTFNKTKRVNLRLTERDFQAAQIKAMEEGLPYQTLLSSVIHKYLTGTLAKK